MTMMNGIQRSATRVDGFVPEPRDGSLADLVKAAGALTPARALGYVRQLAFALAEVHASAPGAFHGDIALERVLFRDHTAWLAEAGPAWGALARRRGTPGYVPPDGGDSPKGDVYALGVTLWALLAGREPHPWKGPDLQLLLRPALRELLDGMLRPDPLLRLDLAAVLRRLPAVEAEAVMVAPAKPPASGFRAWLAHGLQAGGVGGLVAWLSGRDESDLDGGPRPGAPSAPD